MLSTEALRDQLDRYADGALRPEALEEWLASESWDMRRWAPQGLQNLVESIQGAFIRYSDGDLSADELNRFLHEKHEQLHRAAVATRAIEVPQREEKPVAASNSIMIDVAVA